MTLRRSGPREFRERHEPSTATPQWFAFVRGGGAPSQLHPRRRRALCDAGGREPAGEIARGRARHRAVSTSAAQALRGRTLRLGIAPQIARTAASTVRKLRQAATVKEAVKLRVTDDLAELLNGRLDAMLRTSGGSHPGLHIDRLVLAGVGGSETPVVLLTHPGLAGCREHRRLLRRLKEMA